MLNFKKLKILKTDLLDTYKMSVWDLLYVNFRKLKDNALSADSFSFYTSVSVVFSSKIEGEEIELDSYLKHRLGQAKFKPDYTKKIDDLHAAYDFAKKNKLNLATLLKAHKLLGKNILAASDRGILRKNPMFVLTNDGRIEYVAAEPNSVESETEKLFQDIQLLLQNELTFSEVFYFAAMIHLLFLKIHPLSDGNGRSARLLEKWFIAEKLGKKAWFMQSEKYYYQHNALYYRNIRKLGLEYEALDYSQALPFLLMLAEVLKMK
jgi:Fic family protein